MEVSTKSSALSRRMRIHHTAKALHLPDEGIVFPLKSEYDRANYTLEAVRQSSPSYWFNLSCEYGVQVQVIPHGGLWFRWVNAGCACMSPLDRGIIFHCWKKAGQTCRCLLAPELPANLMCKGILKTVSDDYLSARDDIGVEEWVWTTTFLTSTSSGSGGPCFTGGDS